MLTPYHKSITATDLKISPAGLGTVKLGRNTDIKYPRDFELPTDKAVQTLLDTAKACGINLIDTAPAYGISEARLGKLLTQRQKWVISTKVGETYQQSQSAFDFSATAVTHSIHQSLKRLNTDYLDIVLIHSDGNDVDILNNEETIDTLHTLKQQGTIRAIGLSGKTATGGILALDTYDLDIAMITHNLIYQEEQAIIDYATTHHKTIFIKKAFASGHLDQLGDNPIQSSMDFIFQPAPQLCQSVILGTLNPKHLQDNCQAIVNAISHDA